MDFKRKELTKNLTVLGVIVPTYRILKFLGLIPFSIHQTPNSVKFKMTFFDKIMFLLWIIAHVLSIFPLFNANFLVFIQYSKILGIGWAITMAYGIFSSIIFNIQQILGMKSAEIFANILNEFDRKVSGLSLEFFDLQFLNFRFFNTV